MDKELERVRAEAAGIELDEELAARFPVKSRQKLEIPGDEADITVYLYEPENRTGVTPLIINLHGGGFVKSYRGRDIILSQNFAWHTGCLVADVDYKTAPEKKYPYAQMEGYRVVEYFYQHAEQYRIDPQRIILSGQSAGANLIIGIAMRFLRREEHPVCQLIMAYPPLDLYKDPMEKPFTESEEEKKMAINGRLYNDWVMPLLLSVTIAIFMLFSFHGVSDPVRTGFSSKYITTHSISFWLERKVLFFIEKNDEKHRKRNRSERKYGIGK